MLPRESVLSMKTFILFRSCDQARRRLAGRRPGVALGAGVLGAGYVALPPVLLVLQLLTSLDDVCRRSDARSPPGRCRPLSEA